MIQENQDVGAVENDAGESVVESNDEVISIPKKEFEKLNQTLGSLKREVKDYKKSLTPEATPTSNTKSNEIDFGQLAYHNTKPDGIRVVHDDDVEFLKATMEETGKSMKDILSSKWFAGELKDRQEARNVVNATPTATRRAGEPANQLEVEYTKYIQTGKLPSDPEMRSQIVNKRIEREGRAAQFTKQSVVES